MNLDHARLEETCRIVTAAWPGWRPSVALVLGSGWGRVQSAFTSAGDLPYDRLPSLGAAGVTGHAGVLVRAQAHGVETLLFLGRRHFYEGEGWTPVAATVHLAKRLGVRRMILTNAAGGLDPRMKPGDLMLVTDHLNLFGTNPLIGAPDPFWGPRFPDQSRVYDATLQRLFMRAAKRARVPLRRGVYAGLSGPAYETPAEVRMLRRLGASAVGMSTVPEAMLAHAAGLDVAALSCITNLAAGLSSRPLDHREVAAVAGRVQVRLRALISDVWAELAKPETAIRKGKRR